MWVLGVEVLFFSFFDILYIFTPIASATQAQLKSSSIADVVIPVKNLKINICVVLTFLV